MKKPYPKDTPIWRFFFVVYCVLLLWLLFDRTSDWDGVQTYQAQLRSNMNLIPLSTIRDYWKVVNRWEFTPMFYHCVINLGGNVILFVPIGYFLPRLWPFLRNFFSFLLFGTLAITLVELLQLVTLLGSLDIDDLILNLLGMVIGYIFFMIFKK